MGLEMPHLKADPSEDPVGRSLRKPWVKLWIQNVPRFLSLKKWYPKFMKPNSAPLATTFWRHPADLTSTARQCRHNLPHFVGFRYRAIVGGPGLDPDKRARQSFTVSLPSNRLEWYTKMPLFEMNTWFGSPEQRRRVDAWGGTYFQMYATACIVFLQMNRISKPCLPRGLYTKCDSLSCLWKAKMKAWASHKF